MASFFRITVSKIQELYYEGKLASVFLSIYAVVSQMCTSLVGACILESIEYI